MERIRKEIGEDILVETKNLSSSGAEVCFSLIDDKWPLWENDECVSNIYGTTLHIHYVTGRHFAQMWLSHGGPLLNEKTIEKEQYKILFLSKYQIEGFDMVTSTEDPLQDEFVYAHHPLWIRNPWDHTKEEDNGKDVLEKIVNALKSVKERKSINTTLINDELKS